MNTKICMYYSVCTNVLIRMYSMSIFIVNNGSCCFQVLARTLPSGLLIVVKSKVLVWMFVLLTVAKVKTSSHIEYYWVTNCLVWKMSKISKNFQPEVRSSMCHQWKLKMVVVDQLVFLLKQILWLEVLIKRPVLCFCFRLSLQFCSCNNGK